MLNSDSILLISSYISVRRCCKNGLNLEKNYCNEKQKKQWGGKEGDQWRAGDSSWSQGSFPR